MRIGRSCEMSASSVIEPHSTHHGADWQMNRFGIVGGTPRNTQKKGQASARPSKATTITDSGLVATSNGETAPHGLCDEP